MPVYTTARMRTLILLAGLALAGLPAVAVDFGDPKDVKQVRGIVTAKFKHALHASVSHDWALCTAYSGESDISVVLRRSGATWKVIASDGGAYVKETLRPSGCSSDGHPGAAEGVSVRDGTRRSGTRSITVAPQTPTPTPTPGRDSYGARS